jgi:hypothetical protein
MQQAKDAKENVTIMKTKTKEDIKNKNQMEFLQMEKCNT